MNETSKDWRFSFMRPSSMHAVGAVTSQERATLASIANLVEVTVGDAHWLEDMVSAVSRLVAIATEPPNATELDGGDDGRIHRFRLGSKFSLCRDATRWGGGSRGLCVDCEEIDKSYT